MIYPGSKNKIGPELYETITAHSGLTTGTWYEPFVGGANMIQHVPEHWRRIGCDINGHIMALFTHCQLNGQYEFDEPNYMPWGTLTLNGNNAIQIT